MSCRSVQGANICRGAACSTSVAGGWQLAGMLRASSGFPLTVTSGVDRSNTAHGYDRPNAVAGVSPDLDNPSPAAWFNVAAFQMPALGTFGNLGRATLTGPGVFTIDFSALKNFHFGSNYLQLRIEAFNLLNTPNFADPNTNLAQSNWAAAGNNDTDARQRRVRDDQFDPRHGADATAAIRVEVRVLAAIDDLGSGLAPTFCSRATCFRVSIARSAEHRREAGAAPYPIAA